ncbi:MAG TPA: NAD(+)/NADH kinase [Bacteroidota bacterium]|jgi:NAD+ kinase|nr:NAD(+)/NADH kinase [Bacteroidota bacterium]
MRFGIIGHTGKPIVKEVAEQLLGLFHARKLEYVIHDDLGCWMSREGSKWASDPSKFSKGPDLPGRCDMLVSLGGDGTMLTAARMVGEHGTPILGINLGKLGFLAEVSAKEIERCIDEILSGSYTIEDRVALTASADRNNKSYFALNEFVVDRGSSPRLIDLETAVNGEYLATYAADGIIVTTPTGSTAYSLANGGPLVVPQSDVLVITPIAPHTLTARPVIIPSDQVITVVIQSAAHDVHITADGQIEGFYQTPVKFTIRKAPYATRLVKRKERSYFHLLRTKLLWGRDGRQGLDSRKDTVE